MMVMEATPGEGERGEEEGGGGGGRRAEKEREGGKLPCEKVVNACVVPLKVFTMKHHFLAILKSNL